MKRILTILSSAFLLVPFLIQAQVGVGTTTPSEFAILDAVSTTDGFIVPRISQQDRDDNLEDNNPSTTSYNHPCGSNCETVEGVLNNSTLPIGTLIFDTDDGGYEFWNGTTWTKLAGSAIGGGASTLPEITAVDGSFNAGTPITVNWVAGDQNDGDLSGPVPFVGGNITGNNFRTDLVVLGFRDDVDGSGDYWQDSRSDDIKNADLFEWKQSTDYASGLNTVFWPESNQATYDFQFTFDYDVNAGGSGKSLVIGAWWGDELVGVVPADYNAFPITTISMNPNQLVRESGATGTLGRPFLEFIKVIPGGNNESYTGFTITLRCLSSDRALNNGFVFTLRSDVDLSVKNLRVVVTRVR